MLEIADQKIWEASQLFYKGFKKEDQERRLDPDNISQFKRQHIKPLYPHKVNQEGQIEKYGCCQSCCTIDPGSFCCCTTQQPDSSFRKLGLGLCLYFKFTKHASIVFMIVAILTLVTCLACYLVSIENGFAPTDDYQTFLFSTTLGVFSSERLKCSYKKIPNPIAAVTFTLTCPYGKVNHFGATFSKQTLNTLYNCKNEKANLYSGDSTYQVTTAGLTSSCTSDGTSCTISFTPSASSLKTISYSYECLDQTYKYSNFTAKSHYIFYGVIAMDLLCCLILALFYCSQSKAQDAQIEYFKEQQLSLSDFSLKIKGLNIATFDSQFNAIVSTLTSVLGGEFNQELVQVKTPDRIDFVEYQNKKNEAYQNLVQFISQRFFDLEVDPSKFKNHQQFIEKNFAQGQYAKFKYELTQLISQYTSLQYDANSEKINKKCSIFLVVNSMRLKKRLLMMQKEGCCSNYYQINDKQYKLSQPPAPDLIIWKNKGKWTFFRSIISWIITLAICFGSYILFGYIQQKQNDYLSAYNFNINCDVLYNSLQMSVYTPIAGDDNYLSCFCKTNLWNFSYDQCKDWRTTYFTYLAIPIVISMLLVMYNVIVSSFFKILSKFESHRLVTDELYSYTVKRSFMLIMNMALIMIMLNMKYTAGTGVNQVGFLLQGRYNDLTPDWYMNIGTIIILTMIFNISFPIVEMLLASMIKCIKRCWDKKCCMRKTSCKTKSEYISLFSNDIYPIEERYAFLISVILITLSFSCIIPALNLICGLSLMLLYFVDRVLVFKIYQTPVNYGSELHLIINKVVYFALIAHFALSAFFLSQPRIIASYSTISSSSALNSNNERINAMISVYYIIPYVVLLGLFLGWSIFSNTLIALCSKCCDLICKKSEDQQISKYKIQQRFYDSLTPFQLSRLKRVIEAELSKLAVKNSTNKLVTLNNSSYFNQTIKELSINPINQSAPKSEHQALLRRTLMRITAEETLRKRQKSDGANLIGAPSYELMVSDDACEQDKKNSELSSALNLLLNRNILPQL